MQGDRVRDIVLGIISNSQTPLETPEILEQVLKQIKTTRTIVFKRLTDLRGDGAILGAHIGSGKGTWIWFKKEQNTPPEKTPVSDDKIAQKVLNTIFSSQTPLETKQIEDIVRDAIPTTRTIIFKRLTDLRGDGVLRGKVVGSGKGTWIWWRENATR
jgi:hypothetical protein